ncbi:WXG100 family type VII secretion target [Allocatelliglobosispora scoriae]|uniref:WXG100 family type VII secretion target n=1 Tax=Allocatelliglobosispora scoriae TaxID=643052 RepID=A0A841BKM6_9ACTN|nr:WXG100 family type VII secretion target [Allocatelliglobosispora scoriae]MBB5867553.1 WXG100 family type VII secretion target [Allocatelliglobosispora scoriae]
MGSPDYLKVNFESVEGAARAIQNAMVNMEQELVSMANKLRPMVETWSFEAQQAYVANQEQWQKKAELLNQTGIELANQIIKAKNIMWDTEQAAVALQRSFSV